MPRSDVEGTLYIDGNAVPFKGQGYHDKNWGNANIHDSFRSWYWGRLYDPEFTLIFYRLFPVDENDPPISRLLLAKKDQPIVVSNDYIFRVEDEMVCEMHGKKIPLKMVIQSNEGIDPEFYCELKSTEVREEDRLPPTTEWAQYNWRFEGRYNLRVKTGGDVLENEGTSIHEYMLFR